jgi:hypothetical protein
VAGFDLHANVDVRAPRIAIGWSNYRYLLRPAVAQDRLQLRDDGRIVRAPKTSWADGTRQLVFESLELLEKLAARGAAGENGVTSTRDVYLSTI